MAPSNPEHDDTLQIDPVGFRAVDDDDVKTREYRRPNFAPPAPWTIAEPLPATNARRRSSKHTITKTVPALRRMVGMPVHPSLALPAAPKPSARSVKVAPRPMKSKSRALATAMAFLATLLAIAAAVIALTPPAATQGSVIVTAYGASGLPSEGFKVIADGTTRCDSVPCNFELEPGDHWVTVVAPGYELPSSRRVFVSERSESSVHFELVPSSVD